MQFWLIWLAAWALLAWLGCEKTNLLYGIGITSLWIATWYTYLVWACEKNKQRKHNSVSKYFDNNN